MPAPRSSAAETPSFVYALGRVEPRFPSLAIEKEFAQAAGQREGEGITDRQLMRDMISQRDNRYLARHLCWVFSVEGLDTYILYPRDPADLDLLIAALRPEPRRDDLDVVIGVRGPIAPPEACDGLAVPTVIFDQIYSFDRDSLLESIPRPESVSARKEEQFRAAAAELFDRIAQLADNAGATDEQRALNYLAVRYPRIYSAGAEALDGNATLTAVDVKPSRLSSVRKVVDVIFSYTHRQTDVTEKSFIRVDVTEEYPFLVTKLSPYYDR